MADQKLALVAHLMRRAGFGATRAELEGLAVKDYEDVVEDLLHPQRFPLLDDEDILGRYYMYTGGTWAKNALWFHRMINSKRPLEEKIALFWHHVFATAWNKSEHTPAALAQVGTFRRNGLSDVRTILTDLSKDPAMLFWLDNCENHKTAPNENYGREILELFSMGVGNYTEFDLKEASRAFTGWTFMQPIPLYPYGDHPTWFEFRRDDHDDGVKTFLGEKGRFNGEDIIDIIVRQPATARFISRHLYNFFVADEAQVPAWNTTAARDPEAIHTLMKAYFDSGGGIRAILWVLFNSAFFKEASFKRVKSPAELVVGVIKLVGTHGFPEEGLSDLHTVATAMGQRLMNPPTVEGWHTGKEWIDGGTLNERVNYAVDVVGDVAKPGVRDIVARLSSGRASLSTSEFVDRCLDLAGPLDVGEGSRRALLGYAQSEGDLRFDTEAERQKSAERVGRMLQLIVSTWEYQFA